MRRLSRASGRRPGRGDTAGFSLMELVLVLGIIAALGALLAPTVIQIIEAANEGATRSAMRTIAEAAVGDPAAGTFGYVGDVGEVPAALADLITKPPSVSSYTTSGTQGGVGIGWRGPYVDRGFFPGDEFRDEWGNTFEWGGVSGTGGGRTGRGQIRSAGRDGVLGNGDDILFPLDAVDTNGTLLVTVFVNGIPNPLGVTVTLYRAVNGAQNVQTTQSTSSGFAGFSFAVHQGTHAVKAVHTSSTPVVTVERTQNIIVLPRNQHQLEIRLRTTGTVTT